MTLAEIDDKYGTFFVYIDTMRAECTQFVGRVPYFLWVDDADQRIQLCFEWSERRHG